MTRAARILLKRALDEGGLKLTATGNLSRAVVAEMIEVIEWPGLEKDELYRFNKVINEPDFLPVHFVRVLMQGTKLVRKHHDKLVVTRVGKGMLAPERHGALQALLFHVALWHLNLGYLDRNPIDTWPQSHTGIVLWSLSTAANDWLERADIDAHVYGSGRRCAGVGLGSRLVRHGGPHSEAAFLVWAAGISKRGSGGKSAEGSPFISEDPAVRSLHQVRRPNRTAGDAALTQILTALITAATNSVAARLDRLAR